MGTGSKELGFVCTRCQMNLCTECIDVMRVVFNQKLICKCDRRYHDGEPRDKQIVDPFTDTIHGPNLEVSKDGSVAFINSITCPACKMTSHNPNDITNQYCGNCNQFHYLMDL